jgi:hypothetical protein
MIGDAVEHGDRQCAEAATAKLRNLRDDLMALSGIRNASDRIIRHALSWRRRPRLVAVERERAAHLDLLAGSCLMLARTATAVGGPLRGGLAATVRQLAAALDGLAEDPGDQATRQNAAERAAELAIWLVEHGGLVPAQSPLAAAYASIRMVAADVMVFAGVDPEQPFPDTSPCAGLPPSARAVAAGLVLLQWHGVVAPGPQQRFHDVPGLHGLVAPHRERRVAGEHPGEDLPVGR